MERNANNNGSANMSKTEIRNEFNAVIAKVVDASVRAKLEVAREYFTNDDFRRKLADYVYQLNMK